MKTRKTGVAIAIALLLAVAADVSTKEAAAGMAGTITATARVCRKVEITAINDSRVAIRANTGWQLVAETTNGIRTLAGERTGSEPVPVKLPAGTKSYFVTMER